MVSNQKNTNLKKTNKKQGLNLTARYHWLFFAVVFPPFLVVMILAVNQYQDQREQVLHVLSQTTFSHSIALDSIAKLASDHVMQMKAWSENYLKNPPSYPSDIRSYFAPRYIDGKTDSYTLDNIPPEIRQNLGQLGWAGKNPQQAEVGEIVLDHALEFFALARLTHDVTHYFRWSYFFSGDENFAAVYPWFNINEVIEAEGYQSMREAISKWFQYDIYLMGTPQRNPQRQAYWTEPYMDAGGTGAMLSHGAPVYKKDKFLGIVGTDVRLETLEQFLKSLPIDVGRLLILNSQFRLLADSQANTNEASKTITKKLPRHFTNSLKPLVLQRQKNYMETEDSILVLNKISNAPWFLVYRVSHDEIKKLLLPQFLPYAIILSVLLASVFVALYLLRKEFIIPALKLVQYIEHASTTPNCPAPKLPNMWQRWADIVTRTFKSNYEKTLKLKDSEEQYRSIFYTTSDGLILWNAKGKLVDANPATWEMLGYSKQEFFNKPFQRYIDPKSMSSFVKFKSEKTASKTSANEIEAIGKNGLIVHLELRSIPMPYQGRPHILMIVRNISEQKKAAEELARQRETLRQTEKLSAMGGLLAGVAHELNNPLSILMGRTTLLKSKIQDQSLSGDVDKIHTAAERCGRIVHTFLSMVRNKKNNYRPSNINDVVISAIELLGYGLRTSGIEVITNLDESLPDTNMDADQVGQIIINLLVNAQQVLTERPQPRHITITTLQSNGGTSCTVSDNGPGIADPIKNRIFEPFFTTKSNNIGTGIGLSVSQNIAHKHGGKLELENNKPGATFKLWLPLNAPDFSEAIVYESNNTKLIQIEHVLIVDDEQSLTAMVAEILHSAGLKTSRVHSGQEALNWLKNNDCDMILSDIRMRDKDGPALWQALNTHHPTLNQKTAFMTGDMLSADIPPFLQQTRRPWLEKPFTPEQLLELVAKIESQ